MQLAYSLRNLDKILLEHTLSIMGGLFSLATIDRDDVEHGGSLTVRGCVVKKKKLTK